MTEDHGMLYNIIELLLELFILLGLTAGIAYVSIILKELLKGVFGKD